MYSPEQVASVATQYWTGAPRQRNVHNKKDARKISKDTSNRALDTFGRALDRAIPEAITGRASLLGGFTGSLVFTVLVGYITAMYTEVCVIGTNGVALTTPSYCESHPTGYAGMFPNYANNIGILALGVAAARYACMALNGEWSQGDMSPEFTILRWLSSAFVKSEPTSTQTHINRVCAIVGQLVGAFTGVLLLWALLQTTAPYTASNIGVGAEAHYYKSGSALGAPMVSITGQHNGWATVTLALLTAFIRGLVFLWEHDKSNWESPEQGGNWLHRALAVVWCHLKAIAVAIVDAGLVLFSGASIGTGMFMAKDLAQHILTSAGGYSPQGVTTGFNIWVLYYGWPVVAYTVAFIVYILMKLASGAPLEVAFDRARLAKNTHVSDTQPPRGM